VERSPLNGRSILVVEDEPMIAMDIEQAFARCGADVAVATTVRDAMQIVDDGFALGILDHGLPDGHGTELYELMHELGVPFIIYTGHDVPEGDRSGGVVVAKPAAEGKLRAVGEGLVSAANVRSGSAKIVEA
jgi:DNA-binding response OmpR family regulator